MHRSYREQAICHPINQLLHHDNLESFHLDYDFLKDEFITKNELPIRSIKPKSGHEHVL